MPTDSDEGFTFVWRIENFSFCAEKEGECIESPDFCPISSSYKWRLHLFPRQGSNGIGYRLFMAKSKNYACIIKIDYELLLMALDGSSYQTILYKDSSFHDHLGFIGKLHIISRDKIFKMKNLFLPNDVLTIRCRIWFKNDMTSGETFARTRIGVDSWKFTWIEKQFSDSSTKNRTVVVKTMPTNSSDQFWNVKVIKCSESIGDESIRFDIQKNGEKIKFAIFKADMIDSQGKTLDFAFDKQYYGSTNQVWTIFSSFTKKQLLENSSRFLPNDVLTLKCEFINSAGVVSNHLEDMDCETSLSYIKSITKTKTEKNSNPLLIGLQFLYRERKLCDSSLQTKSGTFPVHKAVLGARSSVFCTMFEHKMKETQTNVVDIPDLDDDTVKRMLDYIYTDTIEELEWEGALKLYYAADKYGLLSLKKKCSSFIQETVDVSNVCQTLVLANMHHDQELVTTLMNYISEHDEEIFFSEDWRRLENSHSKLSNETLRVVFMKRMKIPKSK